MKNRLIIAGGRDFKDWRMFYQAAFAWIDEHDPNEENTIVFSGMAEGADEMGYLWSEDRGIPRREFPADWDRYGRTAGYRRNHQMAMEATHLLAFWDGQSKGTKDMITRAKAAGLHVTVVKYNQPKEIKTLW